MKKIEIQEDREFLTVQSESHSEFMSGIELHNKDRKRMKLATRWFYKRKGNQCV